MTPQEYEALPIFRSDEFPVSIRVYRDRTNEFVTAKVKRDRLGDLVFIVIPRDDESSYERRDAGLFKITRSISTIVIRRSAKIHQV